MQEFCLDQSESGDGDSRAAAFSRATAHGEAGVRAITPAGDRVQGIIIQGFDRDAIQRQLFDLFFLHCPTFHLSSQPRHGCSVFIDVTHTNIFQARALGKKYEVGRLTEILYLILSSIVKSGLLWMTFEGCQEKQPRELALPAHHGVSDRNGSSGAGSRSTRKRQPPNRVDLDGRPPPWTMARIPRPSRRTVVAAPKDDIDTTKAALPSIRTRASPSTSQQKSLRRLASTPVTRRASSISPSSIPHYPSRRSLMASSPPCASRRPASEPTDAEREVQVRFGATPGLSFGDTSGQSVPGVGIDGGVTMSSAIFVDGFESGGTLGWSLSTSQLGSE